MPRAKKSTKTRSPSGMGTISLRADNRWWSRITLDDGKRKAFYGHTEAEVREKLIKALGEKQKGTLISKRVPTLKEFIPEWLDEVARPKLKASTHLRYSQLFNKHILPSLGKHNLVKLSPQHLQRFYNDKLAAGLAPRTVGHMHRALRVSLETALRWGYVQRNVCNLVAPPRVSRADYQVFTPEQARRFLESIQGDPLEAYYILALTTGMRSGEIRGLRWDDLDMEKGIVTVKRSIRRVDNKGWVESEPKTKKSWRVIPLIQPAMVALHNHRARQLEQRLQMGPLWEEKNRVFCNSLGRPLEDQNIAQRSFKPLLRRAGLPDMRLHDLRHSAASMLLAFGVEMKTISEILGHSSLSITADLYTHVLSETTKEAVSRLNRLFKAPI